MIGGLMPSTPRGLFPSKASPLMPGVEERPLANLITPAFSYDFKPVNTLYVGVRGEGKSLAMVAMAQIMEPNFHAAGWRIQSNFRLDFADFQHPFLGRELSANMYRAWESQLNIDEITELIPSKRVMSNVNMNWFTVMRQIRKLRCEVQATTQFPWDIDKQMLRQVELMALCRGYFPANRHVSAKAAFSCYVDVYFFDLHGGLRLGAQPVKVYPPPLHTAFKSFRFRMLPYVWHKYDTEGVVASDHASEDVQARMVQRQWNLDALQNQSDAMAQSEAEWDESVHATFAEGAEHPDTPTPVDITPLDQEPQTQEAWLRHKRMIGRFKIRPADLAQVKLLRDSPDGVRQLRDIHPWLEAAGWTISKEGKDYYANP